MITHSAKELGQQKEQWVWGLKVTRKKGEGVRTMKLVKLVKALFYKPYYIYI